MSPALSSLAGICALTFVAAGAAPAAALSMPQASSSTAALAVSAADIAQPGARQDYGGTPPLWVEHPYVKKVGKRAEIRASVYVDPYRRPNAKNKKHRNKKADTDSLRFRVTVGKKRFTDPKRTRAINPNLPSHVAADYTVKRKVAKRGVVDLKIRLGKKASRTVLNRKPKERTRSVAISVLHSKDTFGAQKHTAKWGLKQVHDAGLQKSRPSKKERKVWLKSAKAQLKADRMRINATPEDQRQLAWNGSSPMYNYIYMTNSTPFAQQVQFNPNVQCMWTGSAQQFPPVITTTLPTGSLLQMTYILEPNAYSPDTISGAAGGDAWSGLNGAVKYMNPPNSASDITADLVDAGEAAGQALLTSLTQTSTYSEAGAIAAVGNAALTFIETAIIDLIGSSGCSQTSSYPEMFAVSTSVVGFGTNSASEAWNADLSSYPPNTWMTTPPITAPGSTTFDVNGPTGDPNYADNKNGQDCTTAYNTGSGNCYWTTTTQVGSQNANTSMSDCQAPPNSTTGIWCDFVYNTLQPMLGAQTSATYYWNGGQPAPMVSNNASSGTFTGGAASFQGGLFQAVGPNPGLPGDAWCWGSGEATTNCSYADNYTMWSGRLHNYNPMGAMNVQLTYLSTPQFTSGMSTTLASNLTASVQDVTEGISATCEMADMSAQLQTPFGNGGTTLVSDATLASSTTTTNGTQNPTNAEWMVTFYGLDSNGDLVYYNDSPGTSTNTYELAPGAPVQTFPFVASGPQTQPSVTILDSNLNNMQTLADIQSGSTDIATLAAVGCSAVPMVSLPGLDLSGTDLTVATNFGQAATNKAGTDGWPMPITGGLGWPSGIFQSYGNSTNYSWMTPVNAVNVSFQGLPEVATTAVSCNASATNPTCSAP